MTGDVIAKQIIDEAIRRGYDPVPPLADAIQESGLRPGVVSANGKWIGIFQQDASYSDRNNPTANITQFFDRLDAKRKTAGWSDDLWLNIFWLQQRPGETSADLAYRNGRKAYLTEIKSRTGEAQHFVALYGGTMPAKPAFNEFPIWTKNCKSRGGVKPSMFLLHTQEGGGGNTAAADLANYCVSTEGTQNPVSYHYYIGQASDGGVTVVDGVDTDLYSYSVGNANPQSINLCFAGSRASWTREQWLKQASAIDVAAYLAVQDCHKYGMSTLVVPPPYTGGKPGISDHNWVTKVFGWGSHTDVGPNFPWDVFALAVAKYVGDLQPITPTTPEVPVTSNPYAVAKPGTEGGQVSHLWDQLLIRWDILGGRTPVEALAAACAKLGVAGCIDVKAGN